MTIRSAVFVLGMTCNGLSVVRSLGRRGIRVFAVDSHVKRPGLRSRYCQPVKAPSNIIDDEQPWLQFLIGLAKQEETRPVLFPTEDAYVLFLARHREELACYFEFNIPPDEVVEASVSKLGTYQLAVSCGIPTPWTFLIRTVADYEQIADQVTFPCVLKPSYAHVWLQNYTHEKLLVIDRPEQLETCLEELANLEIEVVLQEMIPGKDSQVYVFPVYVSRQKEVLGYANLRKLRQQPVDFGIGAFDVSVHEPVLTETALKLIKQSGFCGMASTEYKWDCRDERFKLIDINPRTCQIGELAIASGVDLPYLYYCDVLGQPAQQPTTAMAGLKWFGFDWDFPSFLEYRRRGELTLVGWLDSLRGPRVYPHYATDDLRPFFAACLQFGMRGTRRLLREFSPRQRTQH